MIDSFSHISQRLHYSVTTIRIWFERNNEASDSRYEFPLATEGGCDIDRAQNILAFRTVCATMYISQS